MQSNPSRSIARRAVPHVREAVIVVGAYFTYLYTRQLVFSDAQAVAFENASRVVSIEKNLGFFWEPTWQRWALDSANGLVVFFNWAYIITFLPIVLTAAVTLYIVNRRRYLFYRNLVMLTFVFALLMFMLFPLAPPRMLGDHFVDTIKLLGPAFYASRELAHYYNAFAAMPSLHFTWTVIFGIIFMQSGRRWLKVLGVLYPMVTLFAITITGNHYILDAIAGATVVLASFGMLRLIQWRRRAAQLT